jgi:hypothetical protein
MWRRMHQHLMRFCRYKWNYTWQFQLTRTLLTSHCYAICGTFKWPNQDTRQQANIISQHHAMSVMTSYAAPCPPPPPPLVRWRSFRIISAWMNQFIMTSYPLTARYLKHDKVTSCTELTSVAIGLLSLQSRSAKSSTNRAKLRRVKVAKRWPGLKHIWKLSYVATVGWWTGQKQ